MQKSGPGAGMYFHLFRLLLCCTCCMAQLATAAPTDAIWAQPAGEVRATGNWGALCPSTAYIYDGDLGSRCQMEEAYMLPNPPYAYFGVLFHAATEVWGVRFHNGQQYNGVGRYQLWALEPGGDPNNPGDPEHWEIVHPPGGGNADWETETAYNTWVERTFAQPINTRQLRVRYRENSYAANIRELQYLVSPGRLTLSAEPVERFIGSPGGPYAPARVVYSLSNQGHSSIEYRVESSSGWLAIEGASGTLAAGESVDIGITLTSAADSLPLGDHGATLSFLNLTNGAGDTQREVTLRLQNVSPGDDLDALRANMNARLSATDLPCIPYGDINRDDVGNSGTDQKLVFSESVSYALLSNVLRLPDEDAATNRALFAACWQWTREHMQRMHVDEVYDWNRYNEDGSANPTFQTWIPMPDALRDHLLAWRWVEDIEHTDRSGLILQTREDPHTAVAWHDGSQVASDGDLLVAYALFLAYQRGWGEEYLAQARAIVEDLREKAVVHFQAGRILAPSTLVGLPHNLFYGPVLDADGSTEEPILADGAIQWRARNSYLGFWHEPTMDLSALREIQVRLAVEPGAGAFLDVRLEDVIDGLSPGHVWRVPALQIDAGGMADYRLGPDAFIPDTTYGPQGTLDWSRVKNLWLQLGESATRDATTFPDGNPGEPRIDIEDTPGVFAWSGNRNLRGFQYMDAMDLRDLAMLRLRARGPGALEIHLLDADGGQVYTRIYLGEDFQTFEIDPNALAVFPYGAGNLRFDAVNRVQFQVSDYNDLSIAVEYLELVLPEGRVVRIENQPLGFSDVGLGEITLELGTGQTSDNDGLHLTSNAHGAVHLNPSYFMPFAYRAFQQIDPDGADLWRALLAETYRDFEKSLSVTLYDFDGAPVVGNGMLFPNWLQLNRISGALEDVSTQVPGGNVAGFQFGYDAFRALHFLTYDYLAFRDKRALALLRRVLPFFQQELAQRGYLYPVYRIDGTPDADYEAHYGFSLVIANLFDALGDEQSARQILDRYPSQRCTAADGRAWLMNEHSCASGEQEYFMNYWGLFAAQLSGLLKRDDLNSCDLAAELLWLDTDADGAHDGCDADDDGDGVADAADAFPLDAGEWADADGDGIGNNADPDDDNDRIDDADDPYPFDAALPGNSEWISIREGLNLIVYGRALAAEHADCGGLLADLGGAAAIAQLIRFDSEHRHFEDCGGEPDDEFPIRVGEAYFVRAHLDNDLLLPGSQASPPLALSAGLNLRGHPQPPVGHSCHRWLMDLGAGAVSAIRRLNRSDGRFEGCAFVDIDGVPSPAGRDFPIVPGEGYMLFSPDGADLVP